MKLEITNDFHGTTTTVTVDSDGAMPRSRARAALRRVCGLTGCKCQGHTRIVDDDLHLYSLEPIEHGRSCGRTRAACVAWPEEWSSAEWARMWRAR